MKEKRNVRCVSHLLPMMALLLFVACGTHVKQTIIPENSKLGVAQVDVSETAYAASCPLEGYRLVWHDEFDADGPLGDDWTYQEARAGWVNHELQTYVKRVSPAGESVAECSGGALRIHCFKENGKVYSGRVYAKVHEGWQYATWRRASSCPREKARGPLSG